MLVLVMINTNIQLGNFYPVVEIATNHNLYVGITHIIPIR